MHQRSFSGDFAQLHSFASNFVLSGHAQNAVSMGAILRVRRGATLQSKVDIFNGLSNFALSRRRALYQKTVDHWREETLFRYDPSLKELPDSELAILDPGGRMTYYLLRNRFITDYQRCKPSLLQELSAHKVDGVSKLDHSRAASKKLTIIRAGGLHML